MIERGLAGLVLAGAIAAGARRHRSLSRGGAFAALIIGTAAVLAGWAWGAVLVTFFLTATVLSRYRHTLREARIASIVEKGDERDATQVVANGGVFAVAAVTASITGDPNWAAAGVGALAAATADTFGTAGGSLGVSSG